VPSIVLFRRGEVKIHVAKFEKRNGFWIANDIFVLMETNSIVDLRLFLKAHFFLSNFQIKVEHLVESSDCSSS